MNKACLGSHAVENYENDYILYRMLDVTCILEASFFVKP